MSSLSLFSACPVHRLPILLSPTPPPPSTIYSLVSLFPSSLNLVSLFWQLSIFPASYSHHILIPPLSLSVSLTSPCSPTHLSHPHHLSSYSLPSPLVRSRCLCCCSPKRNRDEERATLAPFLARVGKNPLTCSVSTRTDTFIIHSKVYLYCFNLSSKFSQKVDVHIFISLYNVQTAVRVLEDSSLSV